MGNKNIIIVFGMLLLIGIIVLIIIQSTNPEKIVRQTDIIHGPSRIIRPSYPSYPSYPNYPRYPSHPSYPSIPASIVGDRSTPFCEHTSNGCYPGTQTPIP